MLKEMTKSRAPTISFSIFSGGVRKFNFSAWERFPKSSDSCRGFSENEKSPQLAETASLGALGFVRIKILSSGFDLIFDLVLDG